MDQKFNAQFTRTYPDQNTEFLFQKVEINDSMILNVLVEGIADTTFELPLNSQQAINILSDLSNFEENEDNLGIEPKLIIGDHQNFKIHIVASQIGKLILKCLKEPKSVTLSIGSKWFGKGDQTTDEDFDKLMFVLANVKELISS